LRQFEELVRERVSMLVRPPDKLQPLRVGQRNPAARCLVEFLEQCLVLLRRRGFFVLTITASRDHRQGQKRNQDALEKALHGCGSKLRGAMNDLRSRLVGTTSPSS